MAASFLNDSFVQSFLGQLESIKVRIPKYSAETDIKVVPWSWLTFLALKELENSPSGLSLSCLLTELTVRFNDFKPPVDLANVFPFMEEGYCPPDTVVEAEILYLSETTRPAPVAGVGTLERTMLFYLPTKLVQSAGLLREGRVLKFSGIRLLRAAELSFLPTPHVAVIVSEHEMAQAPYPWFDGRRPGEANLKGVVSSVQGPMVTLTHGAATARLQFQSVLSACLLEAGNTVAISNVVQNGQSGLYSASDESVIVLSRSQERVVVPVIPASPSKGVPYKTRLAVTHSGRRDYLLYPERLCLASVSPGLTNVFLFGRVTHISRTKQVKTVGVGTLTSLQLEDESGAVKVSLVDAARLPYFRSLHVGMLLFLGPLKTCLNCPHPNGGAHITGTRHTRLFPISALRSLFTSQFLPNVLRFGEGVRSTNSLVRSKLLELKEVQPDGWLLHAKCGWPLSEGDLGLLQCACCQRDLNPSQYATEAERVLGLQWVLQDDRRSVGCVPLPGLESTLLDLSPTELQALPAPARRQRLAAACNRDYLFSLCVRNGLVRIDFVIALPL